MGAAGGSARLPGLAAWCIAAGAVVAGVGSSTPVIIAVVVGVVAVLLLLTFQPVLLLVLLACLRDRVGEVLLGAPVGREENLAQDALVPVLRGVLVLA